MSDLLISSCIILVVLTTSCNPTPLIPVSDSIELGIGEKYSDYVGKLNASASGDTIALHDFLAIDYLYDGAAYEHGWVLIELMRKLGDATFTHAIRKLNEEQLGIVRMYFRAGLDLHTQSQEIPSKYPNTFRALGIANGQ